MLMSSVTSSSNLRPVRDQRAVRVLTPVSGWQFANCRCPFVLEGSMTPGPSLPVSRSIAHDSPPFEKLSSGAVRRVPEIDALQRG